MNNVNLSTLTVKDLANAKTSTGEFQVCPAGHHIAKVISFTEEQDYSFVTLEIDGKNYNFFYSFFLKDSDDYNADVFNWIIGLSTIPVTDATPLLAITNSSIGHSYEVETYTYVSKTGKSAGKEQHAIRFNVKPLLTTVAVEEEELTLPF